MIGFVRAAAVAAAVIAAGPALAGPQELLAAAAFQAKTKPAAIAQVNQALAQANAALTHNARDHDSLVSRAIATGYHAQLTRSAGEAKEARRQFEALLAANAKDPEALIGLASWHMNSVADLGGFLAGTVLGASKSQGLSYLNRAVAAGSGRALFPAYAAMLRIRLDPSAVGPARQLAEAAIKAPTPTPIDGELQRRAVRLLVPLRSGNGDAAAALAKQLMPLGTLG